MTYEQVLCPNDTLLLNNSYLFGAVLTRTHEVTSLPTRKTA